MASSLVLLLALSALAGDSKVSAPEAVTPATGSTQPGSSAPLEAKRPAAPRTSVSLAAVGLTGVNLANGEAEFFNDYFSEQLASQGGLRIITRSEVQSVLGFERQKQLLGCSDSDSQCLAEVAGALGVDGLIIGSVARFGSGYGLNLKIISALDARKWAGVSGQVKDEQAVLDFLETSAVGVAGEVKRALGFAPAAAQGTTQDGTSSATAAAPEPVGDAQWTRTLEQNSFRVELFGLRYDRRLLDFLWLGVRTRATSGLNLESGRGTLNGELALLARYEPMVLGPVGFALQGGLASALVGWDVPEEGFYAGRAGGMIQVLLGAELTLGRGWRFSLDLGVPIRTEAHPFQGLGNQLYLTVGHAWFF